MEKIKKEFKVAGIYKLDEKQLESLQRLIDAEDRRYEEEIKKICKVYGVLSMKILYELSKTRMEVIELIAEAMGIEHLLKE